MSNNWPNVPLGEVLIQSDEMTEIELMESYRRVTVKMWGQGAVLRDEVEGGQIAAKKQSVIRTNQFILSRIDARHGATAIVPESLSGAVVSNDFPSFNLNGLRILPQYLGWLSKTHNFVELCKAASEGTTNCVRLKLNRFLKLRIPLPSLDEQRRIIAHIEELAAKVERAQSLREKSVVEVEAVIGTTTAEIFKRGKNDGWKQCQIGDFATETRYGTSNKAHDEPIGVPVLRMGNIQDGQLDFNDLKYLELSEQEFENLRLKPGDILVNRTNSAELVGKCAVFKVEEDFVCASYIIRLRVNEEKVEPDFVARYINSPAGRAYMFAERKQMTGQANINSKKLLALPMAIPPLAEQRRIVAYLDNLQAKVKAVKRHQAATTAKLDALLPSILDKAFKGEL